MVQPPAPVSAGAAVLEAERRGLHLEIGILRRKMEDLQRTLDARKLQTRAHLRLLYKLSSGGYLRLLAGAGSPAELHVRRDGVGRILERDLAELRALREELDELSLQRTRLAAREQRAVEIRALQAVRPAPAAGEVGFPGRPGSLTRPVAAARLVATFGSMGNAVGRFDHVCDGVEFGSSPGQTVRAVAAGEVRRVGPVPGLGLSVIIDHGNGWMSLTGGLKDPSVQVGAVVAPGAALALAAGLSVELQLIHRGNWIDPAPWLAP